MHMWLWYGFDLGPFLFDGIKVVTKPQLAGTCVVLFIIGFLFEGSKVYVARTQRNAARRLYPHKRNDERRNLLIPEMRDAGPSQGTSRGHRAVPIPRKYRIIINLHQTMLYLLHNVVGYLLMLAVMLYNAWLIAAVVLGMVAGYFVFGPMLTRFQTECFVNRGPVCTDKCDENAEGSTPPLLHTSLSSETDFFACQTPSCSRSGDNAPHTSAQGQATGMPTCYYGAKRCPSKVAVAAKLPLKAPSSHCHHDEGPSKEELSQNIEDAMLLREDSAGCCPSTPPPQALEPAARVAAESGCCVSPQHQPLSDAVEAPSDQLKQGEVGESSRDEHEDSPQISCCHNSKISASESQQNIML